MTQRRRTSFDFSPLTQYLCLTVGSPAHPGEALSCWMSLSVADQMLSFLHELKCQWMVKRLFAQTSFSKACPDLKGTDYLPVSPQTFVLLRSIVHTKKNDKVVVWSGCNCPMSFQKVLFLFFHLYFPVSHLKTPQIYHQHPGWESHVTVSHTFL